eukprot:scaffold10456_cov45-Cyclotella_meneghiniana.AAC.3
MSFTPSTISANYACFAPDFMIIAAADYGQSQTHYLPCQDIKMDGCQAEAKSTNEYYMILEWKKDSTKAELEDTREEFDIENETLQQQALATDI